MSWYTEAKAVIEELHATLPADMPFADRKKAVFDAYPFGLREYHPYKQWCKAQREYLARFSEKPAGPLHAMMIAKEEAKRDAKRNGRTRP